MAASPQLVSNQPSHIAKGKTCVFVPEKNSRQRSVVYWVVGLTETSLGLQTLTAPNLYSWAVVGCRKSILENIKTRRYADTLSKMQLLLEQPQKITPLRPCYFFPC